MSNYIIRRNIMKVNKPFVSSKRGKSVMLQGSNLQLIVFSKIDEEKTTIISISTFNSKNANTCLSTNKCY